jgi:hypothetical protein
MVNGEKTIHSEILVWRNFTGWDSRSQKPRNTEEVKCDHFNETTKAMTVRQLQKDWHSIKAIERDKFNQLMKSFQAFD